MWIEFKLFDSLFLKCDKLKNSSNRRLCRYLLNFYYLFVSDTILLGSPTISETESPHSKQSNCGILNKEGNNFNVCLLVEQVTIFFLKLNNANMLLKLA